MMEVNPPELFWVKDQFDVIDDGWNVFQRCTLEIREDIHHQKFQINNTKRDECNGDTLLASSEIHGSKIG